MIKNFLIINCTGKNNIIALRVNNNFFFKKTSNKYKKQPDTCVQNFSFYETKKSQF